MEGWFSEPPGDLMSLMAYVVSPLALESLVGGSRSPQRTKMNAAVSETGKGEGKEMSDKIQCYCIFDQE